MTVPSAPLPIPPIVADIAAGRPVTPVWLNELGGVTFDIDGGAEFVKMPATNAQGEADRLRWAIGYVPVPPVLGVGADWLHTAGLPGRSAVDPHWVASPAVAARAIGAGLRMLHDTLPVPDCPFEWSVPARLAAEVPPDRQHGLTACPPIDRLVVCHGDACAPNTLLDDDGRCPPALRAGGAPSGHVDLGDLGVADRWADIAVAVLSLSWNYRS